MTTRKRAGYGIKVVSSIGPRMYEILPGNDIKININIVISVS